MEGISFFSLQDHLQAWNNNFLKCLYSLPENYKADKPFNICPIDYKYKSSNSLSFLYYLCMSDFHIFYQVLDSYIGEGNGNPLQCSCLETPRDRAAIYGIAQSRTRLTQLSSSSSRHILQFFKGFYLKVLFNVLQKPQSTKMHGGVWGPYILLHRHGLKPLGVATWETMRHGSPHPYSA